MKNIGFLSFGHWQDVPGSQARTGQDALLQTIELAVAAEEVGVSGAYVRVHHFARQLASPFPLLSAMAARTSTIELGTAVIDMRYENPLYMAEEAAIADLISGGRLQLGISRGSPEPALNGAAAFGYVPDEGETDADMARGHTELFRAAIGGAALVRGNPQMGAPGAAGDPAAVPRPRRPHLVGRRHAGHRGLDGRAGHEPDELDPAHRRHRRAVRRVAGRADRDVPRDLEATARARSAPRASRSAAASCPLSTTRRRHYFGLRAQADAKDQVGYIGE